MPRFRKLARSFTIRTGEPPDRIVWHFTRTPPVERGLTAAQAIDDPATRARALLAVMTDALQGWEGVLNEDGQPLPYSPDAFLHYIPAHLRAQVLRRWTAAMLGVPAEGAAEPTEPGQEEGAAVAEDWPPSTGEQLPASTPSGSSDGLGSDLPADQVPPQLPFRTETGDRPADHGALSVAPAPADSGPPDQPSLPFTAPATQPTTSPPLPVPDAARPASQSAEPPSASGPDPRVAQASSLPTLPPGPAQQRNPADLATTPAPAAAPAATPNQSRRPEARPTRQALPDLPPASPPCTGQVCPLLDPDFDWQPVIRPAWEALHKQTCREETAEAAF